MESSTQVVADSSRSQDYSHPEQPVRHSYPLAVNSSSVSTAIGLVMQTIPIILVRLGVLSAFIVAAVIWWMVCGGIALLFSSKDGSGGGGVFLFLIAVGLPAGVYGFLRHYVLYMLKMAHIAVLTRLITEGSLPKGMSQIEYGKQVITVRFGETNAMLALDGLITGVVNTFNATLDWVAGLIPIPGLDGLMRVVEAVIRNATTYIDETIFSYNLARGDDNVWRSSADGLVYYAQNVKAVLKTAVWGLVVDYVLTAAALVVSLLPAWLISLVLPSIVSGFAWVFALVIAFAIRAAFIKPVFLTMVALTFHTRVHNQPIDQGMSSTLSSISEKFRELLERGRDWVQGKGAVQFSK